ncbi:MAG: Rsd/AlgQ family anti-sigma factor [Gammaproteobacteria bacterium]
MQASVAERRSSAQSQLKTLLETRTETLSLYSQLANMRPFELDREMQEMIQEFCEALVDYSASAHFQLYRFIEEKNERRSAVLEVAERVYPRIAESTRFILDFNEKYDCEDHCDSLANLDADLSHLGELLADRILLEDQVISAITKKDS